MTRRCSAVHPMDDGARCHKLEGHIDEHRASIAWRQGLRKPTLIRPCTCECSTGGFCGGCGHAGCGRR